MEEKVHNRQWRGMCTTDRTVEGNVHNRQWRELLAPPPTFLFVCWLAGGWEGAQHSDVAVHHRSMSHDLNSGAAKHPVFVYKQVDFVC